MLSIVDPRNLAKNGAKLGIDGVKELADKLKRQNDATTTGVGREVPKEGGSQLTSDSSSFNRKEITKGFQDHHIISDKNSLTKNHELLDLAGADLQKRSNKIFLPSEGDLHPTRSIHKGRHTTKVSNNLAQQMDEVVDVGKQNNFTKEQYKQALDGITANERKLLKSGERALNKNAREGAK